MNRIHAAHLSAYSQRISEKSAEGTVAVANRTQIEPLHREVLTAWREVVNGSRGLGVGDRIVIALQLERRAKNLATCERLADGEMGDLIADAEHFATGTKEQSPITQAGAIYGFAAAALGFFGLTVFGVLADFGPSTLETAQTGAQATGAAISGFLALASGGVIWGLVRAAQSAAAALEDFSNKQHPSAVLLAEVAPAEKRLFGLFGREVPSYPISAGPLILFGLGFVAAGMLLAFFVGVGMGASS